jgi:hypothetical protein
MNLKKRNEINIFQSIYKKKLIIIILKKKKIKIFFNWVCNFANKIFYFNL